MRFLISLVAVLCVSCAARADELDEVNAKRTARGLPAFVRDPGLTRAAQSCAAFRAQSRLFGHTSNDFRFLPTGATAHAAGCAAYEASYGWMSCCVYDSATYAGAAAVTRDKTTLFRAAISYLEGKL